MVNLDELDALHAGTTQGEWATWGFGIRTEVAVSRNDFRVASFDKAEVHTADAEFTAAIHNAFPALAKELADLREYNWGLASACTRHVGENMRLRQQVDRLEDSIRAARGEADELEAELEQLREYKRWHEGETES